MKALVNMSQMTVSRMSIQNSTPSRQQRQRWLGEQALAWSGLPVVTIRATMFLDSFLPFAGPTVRDRGRIELLFGRGKNKSGCRCSCRSWSLPSSPSAGTFQVVTTIFPIC